MRLKARLLKKIHPFYKDEKAVEVSEFGLILALVSVLRVTTLVTLSTEISSNYSKASTSNDL